MKIASKFCGLGKWKLGSGIKGGRGNRMRIKFRKKEKRMRLCVVWNMLSFR